MVPTVIAVRTRSFGESTENFCQKLRREAGCPVLVVADQSQGEVSVSGDFPKIPVSTAWAKARSLETTDDVMWRCGDYSLFAIREALPDVATIWLLDDDVRINADCIGRFFQPEAWPEADLLAMGYRPATSDWSWFQSIAKVYPAPYRCFFPCLRIAAEAVSSLREARLALGRTLPPSDDIMRWPNDESFVATVLTARGYICRDMNWDGRVVYDDASISWRIRPFSDRQLAGQPRDGKLYHPVFGGADYLAAMRRSLATLLWEGQPDDAIAKLLDAKALHWVAAECGEAAAQAFAREITAALRARS